MTPTTLRRLGALIAFLMIFSASCSALGPPGGGPVGAIEESLK